MKKENIKLSILWVFPFLVIIFMITLTAHAESTYFPIQQNQNGHITQNMINYITNNYNLSENYILIQYYTSSGSTLNRYRVMVAPKLNCNIFGEIRSDNHSFQLYFANLTDGALTDNAVSSSIRWYRYNEKISDGTISLYESGSTLSPFDNCTSSSYISNNNYFDYVTNFNLFTNNSENRELVIFYENDTPLVDVGVAIIPPNALTPEYPTGTTAPSTVPPQVTINNYTWTTAPSFDDSSVINGISSIKDTLVWLATNIQSEISNLLGNLKSLFEYVAETFQYYGNMIIETLNNLIQNFYDNMKSLVEGIYNQIEYIKEPLDQDVIWDNISTTSLVINVNTIKTSLTSFQAAFTGVNEPNEYKIPIHLENLPTSWFGVQTTQYIDLGVINGTVKDGLRLFVWAMVTYGLVVTIFDSISNYINGGGDES